MGAFTAGATVALVVLGAIVALIEVPSRSHRGWSLLPFVVISLMVAATPAMLVIVMAVGVTVAVVLVCLAAGRLWTGAAVNGLSSVAMVAAWGIGASAGPFMRSVPLRWLDMAWAAAVFVVWFSLDTGLRLMWRFEVRSALAYHAAFLSRDVLVGGVVFSFALTAGVLWPFSPTWAVVVAAVPYLLFVALYRSFLRLRDIELATVLALGRLPEAAGTSVPGHSVATARLAVEMGKQAGLRGRDVEQLEKAALLHDLGLVFTATAAVQRDGFTQSDVAKWTGDLLEHSHALANVRSIILDTSEPYRIPGADPSPDVDERARIVAVACRTQVLLDQGYAVDDCVEALYEESHYRFNSNLVALVRPSLAEIEETCD